MTDAYDDYSTHELSNEIGYLDDQLTRMWLQKRDNPQTPQTDAQLDEYGRLADRHTAMRAEYERKRRTERN